MYALKDLVGEVSCGLLGGNVCFSRTLVVFDLEDVLLQSSVNVLDAVLEAAKRPRSIGPELEAQAAAFKDVPVSVARDAVDNIPITKGVEETLEALRFLGIKTAVVGCPSVAIRGIKARLGIDYVMGPELEACI